MEGIQSMNNQEGVEAKPIDSVEALRQILETKQQRSVTYTEAIEVGESLINFFEVLAEAV